MADNNIKEIIQQQEEIWRERSDNSDQNTLRFARRTVQIYGEMKLLTEKEVNNTANMTDEQIIEFLASKKLSTLTGEQELEFCDRFVGDAEKLDFIPPYFWGKAYERVRKLAQNDASQQERLNKIGAMIDMFAQNFDVSGGLVVDGKNNFVSGAPLNFVDVTNIGDVYARFKEMLDARREDVSDNMREIYERDYKKLDEAIAAYDEMYGMSDVDESKADNIAARYDDLSRVSDQAQLHDDKYELISKTKFLDSKGNIEAQFVNANGEQHVDWESGDRLIKGGRADTMFDFARIEYIKRNLGRTGQEIDAQVAEDEINELMVEKLYELDVAEKIAQGIKEKPDDFTNPDKVKNFVQNLSQNGATISDGAYQATVDGEVNGLAGFFSRVKSKVGNGFKKLGNAVSGLFNRVKPNDKLAAARTTGSYESKREKRKQFFVRILKGFGAAFLASALITVIASAAAAVAGVSLAAGLAMVGVITSIVMSAIQIHKWRKAQRANGLPDDLKTMLKDKRLMASLGVSGLAATAMIFGAFGMPTVAAAFGYTALAAGTGKNAIETFKDAKSSGMSNTESIIWSLFNAGAVVAGGFAGRAAGTAFVEYYNSANPENTIFQNKETVEQRTIEHHTDTKEVYTQDALDHAKNICESWYKNDPDLLQARVDAINAYNLEHGTNIDPYRAIMISADAGAVTPDNNLLHVQNAPDVHTHGHHKVFGDWWAREYGVDKSVINDAANLFNPDGSINHSGMNAVAHLDNYVSAHNEVGFIDGLTNAKVVDGHSVQNDHVLKDNVNVNGEARHSVYADGAAAKETVIDNWDQEVITPTDVYNPTLEQLMASYGIYNRQNNNVDVIDRPGAKPDTTITRQDKGQKEPEKPEQPTPVPPKKPAEPEKPEQPTPVPPQKPAEPEKPKEQPALTEGEKPRALLPQNTTETGVVRVIQPEGGIVKKPSVEDIEDVDYEEVEQKKLPSGPTFPALNAHKEEPVFGMTIEDADKFFQLQWQIERGEKDKAKGIKSQYTEDLVGNQDDLNEMRNELGRPTDDEITRAINDAWARQDILKYQGMIAEKEMDIAKIDPNNWSEKKQRKLDNLVLQMEIYKEEIEKLGGEKMLDTSNLVYYEAVKGVGRINKESRGNPVKTQNGKGYEYSEGNQPRVVAGPLSEKQNIDDERRSNANKKKKTKEENKTNKKNKTKTVENKTKEVKNNDERIARFVKAIDKMTDEQKRSIEILLDLIDKKSEKRA